MTSTTSVRPRKISPDDIKAKLTELQGEAAETVATARGVVVKVVVVVGVFVVVGAFVLGRRGGRRHSTVIELKRA